MFYAGDGVSDLSAAKETDLLFAKADKGEYNHDSVYIEMNSDSLDLVTWCENENVPFVTFRDWSSITQAVKDIAAGTVSVKDAARGRI